LEYPRGSSAASLKGINVKQLLESIRSIVGKKSGGDGFPMTTHFMSGRRRYLCRTFVLEPESKRGSKPTIAIILERQRGVLIDLAARFQLTDREIEAVQHLADGLNTGTIRRTIFRTSSLRKQDFPVPQR